MPLKKKKIWVLTFDSAKAKILEWIPEHENLKEIAAIQEDEARQNERELKADRPGRGVKGASSGIRFSMVDHASFKQQASREFLEKLTNFLNDNKIHAEFDSMIVIAPDDVYHTAYEHMAPVVRDKISQHHAKNVTYMPAHELSKYLIQHIL